MGRPTFERPTEARMRACDIRRGADMHGIETLCYDCRGCSIMYFSLISSWEAIEDEIPADDESVSDRHIGCPPLPKIPRDPFIKIYLLLKRYGI